MGYYLAGFEVVGVDIEPQPRYPFEFHLGDAMDEDFIASLGAFDVQHASPPCQAYAETANSRKRTDHPDLLLPVRARLEAWGGPYVIENIATAPMDGSLLLCGTTFGLPLVRHRRFWIKPEPLLVPHACHQRKYGRAVEHGKGTYNYGHGTWEPNWRKYVLPVVWPWMELEESGQAVPPAYTHWIGLHLQEHLPDEAA